MTARALAQWLPRLEPERARLQTVLIGAFNRRRAGELELHARLAPERDRLAATGWLRFRTRGGPLLLAPLLVNGTLARLSAAPGKPDAVAAAALLEGIEPLVAMIETVLGDELHPDGLEAGLQGDPVLIRVDAGGRGGIASRVILAVAPDAPFAPLAPPEIAAGAIERIRLRGRVTLPGPPVPAARLSALAAGDLLVLGIGSLTARLAFWEHGDLIAARVDMVRGVLIVQEQAAAEVPRPAEGAPAELAQLRVPTTVELTGATLSAGDLATLGPGSVVPLPARGGTLGVRLRAGDALVADGELVAVGDGFGVLITQRHDDLPA